MDRRVYLRAAGAGLIAGMRSLSAPALLSRSLARNGHPEGRVVRTLRSPIVSRALVLAAAAEMASDKTSLAPARTAWPSLVWRIASGSLVAAGLARAAREPVLAGALVGGAAAAAATFGAYYLRRALHDRWHVPDRALGGAEDALVVLAGQRVFGESLGTS